MYGTIRCILVFANSRSDWNNADVKLAFDPPENTSYTYNLWAPEIHNLDDRWYMIFTGNVDPDQPSPEQDMLCDFNCPAINHKMFVLESSGRDIWDSEYSFKAELDTFDQGLAIDGTYLQHESGPYQIYSCWYSKYMSWPSLLCIDKSRWTCLQPIPTKFHQRQIHGLFQAHSKSVLSHPLLMSPGRRRPTVERSTSVYPQTKGLNNSSTRKPTRHSSYTRRLGRITAITVLANWNWIGSDPMDPVSWTKHTDYCIFYQNPEEEAHGVGHASFTKSPDDSEWWIVYHGMRDPTNGWSARTIPTQKFDWNEDGTPNFPLWTLSSFQWTAGKRTCLLI